MAIAICTFNRADDCAKTIAALASDETVLDIIDAVYVVDQGTDLVSGRVLYIDTVARMGNKLRYLRQANLGGAGGFTRGLFAVSAVNEHADVILMDDDILCEPETVLRLNAFANLTVEPMLVGAQMLFLYNPGAPQRRGRGCAPADADARQAGGQVAAQRQHAEAAAGASRRCGLQRLVDLPDPGGGRHRNRFAAADFLPVGRRGVRNPCARGRFRHRDAADRGRVARRFLLEGLRRLGAVLQHP